MESAEHTESATSVTTAVVERVSERTDEDPIDLPPLAETIDPDALESMFDSTPSPGAEAIEVEFAYAGYAVTVTEDGIVTVRDDD